MASPPLSIPGNVPISTTTSAPDNVPINTTTSGPVSNVNPLTPNAGPINVGTAFGGQSSPPSMIIPPPNKPAPKGPFVYPPEAFMVPAPGADGNTAYWSGYNLAKANVNLLPSPKGMADFWSYAAACAMFEKPRATNGFTGIPIAGNDGYDDCLRDARNYRWQHDPQSPEFVVG